MIKLKILIKFNCLKKPNYLFNLILMFIIKDITFLYYIILKNIKKLHFVFILNLFLLIYNLCYINKIDYMKYSLYIHKYYKSNYYLKFFEMNYHMS